MEVGNGANFGRFPEKSLLFVRNALSCRAFLRMTGHFSSIAHFPSKNFITTVALRTARVTNSWIQAESDT